MEVVHRTVTQGIGLAYAGLTGRQMAGPPSLPSHLSCDDLYSLHLDACGAPKGYVARKKRPENSMQVLGAVQIGLLARGAQLDGNHYLVNNIRIRVVNGQGRILSAVRTLYQNEPPNLSRQIRQFALARRMMVRFLRISCEAIQAPPQLSGKFGQAIG